MQRDRSVDPVEETSLESFPASDSPGWAMGEEVWNNESANRFEATIAGKTAILNYRRTAKGIVFTHAEVPAELEGHGIGSRVVQSALEFARQHELKVVPLCPFVAGYIRRHPAYADLVE